MIIISDGRISIDIEVDGKQVSAASKELDNLEASGRNSGKGVKEAEEGLKGVSEESTKAGSNIKKFATAIGLVAIAAGAFKVLRASMDDAISRFDTMNQFPRVMEQVGFSAEESERAINRLSDGIEGLPTKLDDVTSTAQQIAVMTGDLDGAVETTLALNNAFLASGASTADAQRGLQQYVQMLSKGEVDLQSWRTLQETMGIALNDVALAFGFAGESAQNDLYAALQSGEITFKEFNAQLIESSNEAGGFADRAKTASTGIATSLQNLRTAVSRNLANIIERFDQLTQAVTGKDIAQNIDSLKGIIDASFKVIGSAIEGASPYVKAFASAVQSVMPVVQALTPALIGMATAYAMHQVINLTTTAIKTNTAVIATATAIKNAYAIATNRVALAIALHGAKLKLTTVALVAYNKVVAIATAVQTALASGMTLASVATIGLSGAIHVLNVAIKVLLGPVGWVTLAIGALVGAVVGLVKWFTRGTAEGERLAGETEKMGKATDSLTDSLDNSSEAYKKNQQDIKDTAAANRDLANRIEDLAAKENKSAAEKQMLASYIEQLNGQVEGLNLAYDEQADALSMSSEELQARLDLMKEEESLISAQERLLEIDKERNEAQMQLEEINALQEEWNRKKEEGTVKAREANQALEELEEQENALKESMAGLAEQQVETEEQIKTSTENIAEAVESGNLRQITSYEDLSDAQKAAFDAMQDRYDDLAEHATNAFDKMNEESKVTAQEMIENLEHNQEMTRQWSENVAELYDWAGKEGHEGFLQWLETMGPESAAELQVVRDMSDEELKRFAELMDEGANVATDSLKTSLGEGFEEAVDVMVNFVDDGSATLREQISASGFDEIGSMIPEGLADGIESGSASAENASGQMAYNVTSEATSALGINSPSRVFKEIGMNITEGLALGINNGTNKVIQAVQQMFNRVIQGSQQGFNTIANNYQSGVRSIQSALNQLGPITKKAMAQSTNAIQVGARQQVTTLQRLAQDQVAAFKQTPQQLRQIAKTAMQFMLTELRNGANRQVNQVRGLARNLTGAFRSTPSQFRQIGLNAMAGLNAGLNAGRGRVMSTARSIANQVAATMKSALKIHSPSRVFRDEIGKWIPEGIALGIRENAKSVFKELDNLSGKMVLASTPEAALGTARMVYSSGGYQASNTPIQAVTSSTGSDSRGMIGLLKEQNKILAALLKKNQDLYISGEKVTDIVNENNAILATINKF